MSSESDPVRNKLRSTKAMIVAPEPLAAETGLEILASGGNAVDAAVACAFVQGVVDPQMCGIGGSGAMAVHVGGATSVLEFQARAGSRVRPDMWEPLFVRETADRYGYVLEGAVNDVGYQSVGVPGTVAGLAAAHARFGSLPWARLLQPAIRLAADGFQVAGNLYASWKEMENPDVVPWRKRLAATAESARIYLRPDGEFYEPGDVIKNPDYAATLERLASVGAVDFYRGEIASRIAADFAANGGLITAEDLASYRVKVTPPIRGTYRGLEIETVGPPTTGMTLLQMLNYLEGFELSTHGWPSAEAALRRIEAMRWAFADRDQHLADPDFAAVPVSRLIDKSYAAAARAGAQSAPVAAGAAHDNGTTHVCVIDSSGNAVSMTHSLGASSGVITPGLGFTYNNWMNCYDPRPGRVNSLEPGKARSTGMTPTFVFREGNLELALGAPGGNRIVTGVLQALINLVDHGMTPVEAVGAPRVDFNGNVVQAENRVPSDVLDRLRELGYAVNRRPVSYDQYFSRVQVIRRSADGFLEGACDPRKDGGIPLAL